MYIGCGFWLKTTFYSELPLIKYRWLGFQEKPCVTRPLECEVESYLCKTPSKRVVHLGSSLNVTGIPSPLCLFTERTPEVVGSRLRDSKPILFARVVFKMVCHPSALQNKVMVLSSWVITPYNFKPVLYPIV